MRTPEIKYKSPSKKYTEAFNNHKPIHRIDKYKFNVKIKNMCDKSYNCMKSYGLKNSSSVI
jgi:hypothetical protein